ncbi:hypothetical protein [Dysgonomonas sp. ZJ709]|uniref:hypothetical protein n=1 Tax=Dysgonomonas sp. ZJ709 TaxID=2709797 RepID=UPI0013EA82DA|nr:hypothetical protein [Dysgonomonas sp. ZJ709]
MTANNTKKEFSVSSKIVSQLLLSLVLGFSILFAVEHYGNVSFIMGIRDPLPGEQPSFYADAPPEYPVIKINYTTPFGTDTKVSVSGWRNQDVYFSDGKFYEYKNKVKVYFNAAVKDCQYGFLFSGIIFILLLFFTKFKLKFK